MQHKRSPAKACFAASLIVLDMWLNSMEKYSSDPLLGPNGFALRVSTKPFGPGLLFRHAGAFDVLHRGFGLGSCVTEKETKN